MAERALNLMEFLMENPASDITKEVVLTGRLKDFKFIIKPLTQEENEVISKRCTTIKLEGGKRTADVDMGLMQNKIITTACIEPDFRNAEMLAKAGLPNQPETFVKKFLLAGESMELYKQIQLISGFDVGMESEIAEAKN